MVAYYWPWMSGCVPFPGSVPNICAQIAREEERRRLHILADAVSVRKRGRAKLPSGRRLVQTLLASSASSSSLSLQQETREVKSVADSWALELEKQYGLLHKAVDQLGAGGSADAGGIAGSADAGGIAGGSADAGGIAGSADAGGIAGSADAGGIADAFDASS